MRLVKCSFHGFIDVGVDGMSPARPRALAISLAAAMN